MGRTDSGITMLKLLTPGPLLIGAVILAKLPDLSVPQLLLLKCKLQVVRQRAKQSLAPSKDYL